MVPFFGGLEVPPQILAMFRRGLGPVCDAWVPDAMSSPGPRAFTVSGTCLTRRSGAGRRALTRMSRGPFAMPFHPCVSVGNILHVLSQNVSNP